MLCESTMNTMNNKKSTTKPWLLFFPVAFDDCGARDLGFNFVVADGSWTCVSLVFWYVHHQHFRLDSLKRAESTFTVPVRLYLLFPKSSLSLICSSSYTLAWSSHCFGWNVVSFHRCLSSCCRWDPLNGCASQFDDWNVCVCGFMWRVHHQPMHLSICGSTQGTMCGKLLCDFFGYCVVVFESLVFVVEVRGFDDVYII